MAVGVFGHVDPLTNGHRHDDLPREQEHYTKDKKLSVFYRTQHKDAGKHRKVCPAGEGVEDRENRQRNQSKQRILSFLLFRNCSKPQKNMANWAK